MYGLLAPDFHGSNGLDQETSVHLLQTYVLPIQVYGLEVVLLTLLIEKFERFLHKMLKLILSLPDTVAQPDVYVLSGFIPVEGFIRAYALSPFGNICRLQADSRQQLRVKSSNSNSGFIYIKKLLIKYDLPQAIELLDNPSSKFRWKRLVKRQTDEYWLDQMRHKAKLYSSLRFLHSETFVPGRTHPLMQGMAGMRDVRSTHSYQAKALDGNLHLAVQ